MNDLISRQAAIDALQELKLKTRKYAMTDDVIDYFLKKLPTADVVEVVRCKDCKHYTSVTAQCDIRGKGLNLIRGEEDFCSRAERREE